VANQFSSTVSEYSYDTTGTLTFVTNYSVAANPSALAFSREVANTNRDNFLFVSNAGSNQVSVFSACVVATLNCGGATGVLSPIAEHRIFPRSKWAQRENWGSPIPRLCY